MIMALKLLYQTRSRKGFEMNHVYLIPADVLAHCPLIYFSYKLFQILQLGSDDAAAAMARMDVTWQS